jgi:phosphopantetheine--protein transferase-like protein
MERSPEPEPRAAVGNDVVDLADPRCSGKLDDARFLDRIFTDAERRSIGADPEPESRLWTHWAAKEAAFKVLSKRLGTPPVFAHREFEVGGGDGMEGVVLHRASRVPWRVVSRDPLHVVALGPDPVAWPDADAQELHWGSLPLRPPPFGGEETLTALLERFSERERGAVHGLPSARVRLEARARLATALAVEEARVEIVCGPGAPGRTPPEVLLDGRPAPADVSLSHHGRWVAWALLVGRKG